MCAVILGVVRNRQDCSRKEYVKMKNVFYLNVYLLREECTPAGEGQRERERERERMPSRLLAVSAEPDVGLELKTEIMT